MRYFKCFAAVFCILYIYTRLVQSSNSDFSHIFCLLYISSMLKKCIKSLSLGFKWPIYVFYLGLLSTRTSWWWWIINLEIQKYLDRDYNEQKSSFLLILHFHFSLTDVILKVPSQKQNIHSVSQILLNQYHSHAICDVIVCLIVCGMD